MYLYIHIIITCLIFYRFPQDPNAEKEVVPFSTKNKKKKKKKKDVVLEKKKS